MNGCDHGVVGECLRPAICQRILIKELDIIDGILILFMISR